MSDDSHPVRAAPSGRPSSGGIGHLGALVLVVSPSNADRLVRLIDLAATDRVLFGTDGHGAPETHWFAATVLRDAWRDVAARPPVLRSEPHGMSSTGDRWRMMNG